MNTVQEKVPSPKQLFDQQPDPISTTAKQVESYISSLRLRYQGAKEGAERKRLRREVMSQIELAGIRSVKNRSQGLEALERIFKLGATPTAPLDGFYRGILVCWSINPVVDTVLRSISNAYLPWMGKRFDAASSSGDNALLASSQNLTKVLWPGYKDYQQLEDGNYAGIEFKTFNAPCKLNTEQQCMALDYDSDSNPKLIIRRVLDELVEIVPGAYLGQMLVRTGSNYRHSAYFALTDLQ